MPLNKETKPNQTQVDQGIMTMKEYSIFPKSRGLEPRYYMKRCCQHILELQPTGLEKLVDEYLRNQNFFINECQFEIECLKMEVNWEVHMIIYDRTRAVTGQFDSL